MGHVFELTVDISYGTTSDVTEYLEREKLITNKGADFGYDPENRTTKINVVAPNKNKFIRWLKKRDQNRGSMDPKYLVSGFQYGGPEKGVIMKGERILRNAKKKNFEKDKKANMIKTRVEILSNKPPNKFCPRG